MRSYPRNSPEAAARIVALVLIADGNVCRSEIETLNQLEIEQSLGLAPGGFARTVHVLCEDLLSGAYGSGSVMCSVDAATLASLLAEVDDPKMQRTVLRLADAAADADRHLAEAEAVVLAAALRQWRIGTVAARGSSGAVVAGGSVGTVSAGVSSACATSARGTPDCATPACATPGCSPAGCAASGRKPVSVQVRCSKMSEAEVAPGQNVL